MLAAAMFLLVVPASGVEVVEDGGRLVLMPFDTDESVDPAQLQVIQSKVVAALERRRVPVVDPRDLQLAVDREADRVQAGRACDDSCMSELADALDAGRLLHGSLVTLGSQVVLQLGLFDRARSKTTARAERTAPDLGVLAAEVEGIIAELFGAPSSPAPPPAQGPGLWTLLGVGGLAVGGLAVAGFGAWAGWSEATMWDAAARGEAKASAVTAGRGALVGVGVGAAVAAAGAALLLLGPAE